MAAFTLCNINLKQTLTTTEHAGIHTLCTEKQVTMATRKEWPNQPLIITANALVK